MKALALLPLLILVACTGERQQASTVPYVSPVALDLAVCSIAARESTSWRAEERIARSNVNASAAARVLLRDYALADARTAQAVVDQLINDPSNTPKDPEGWYRARCV